MTTARQHPNASYGPDSWIRSIALSRTRSRAQTSSIGNKGRTAGYVLTTLGALFLTFDTVLKVLKLAPAVQETTELGYPADTVIWIGMIELVCVHC